MLGTKNGKRFLQETRKQAMLQMRFLARDPLHGVELLSPACFFDGAQQCRQATVDRLALQLAEQCGNVRTPGLKQTERVQTRQTLFPAYSTHAIVQPVPRDHFFATKRIDRRRRAMALTRGHQPAQAFFTPG